MASVVTTRDTDWVTPRTWSTGELVTAAIMNAHVRDQLNALKSPAYFICEIDEGADYTTTSATFTAVDGTDLTATVTGAGGNWLIGFSGQCFYSSGSTGFLTLTVAVDGTNYVGDDGILQGFGAVAAPVTGVSFTHILRDIAAGSRIFQLRWKSSSGGTYGMYAGAGTANHDHHPVFWGIELV
jgi:hypothetical protein